MIVSDLPLLPGRRGRVPVARGPVESSHELSIRREQVGKQGVIVPHRLLHVPRQGQTQRLSHAHRCHRGDHLQGEMPCKVCLPIPQGNDPVLRRRQRGKREQAEVPKPLVIPNERGVRQPLLGQGLGTGGRNTRGKKPDLPRRAITCLGQEPLFFGPHGRRMGSHAQHVGPRVIPVHDAGVIEGGQGDDDVFGRHVLGDGRQSLVHALLEGLVQGVGADGSHPPGSSHPPDHHQSCQDDAVHDATASGPDHPQPSGNEDHQGQDDGDQGGPPHLHPGHVPESFPQVPHLQHDGRPAEIVHGGRALGVPKGVLQHGLAEREVRGHGQELDGQGDDHQP